MKKIDLREIDFTKLLAVAYNRLPNVYLLKPVLQPQKAAAKSVNDTYLCSVEAFERRSVSG